MKIPLSSVADIRRAAINPHWWLGLLLIGFLYVAGSEIYHNASLPIPPAAGSSNLAQDQEFSRLSDLVTAIVKVPWLDTKLKEFEEAAKQYEQTYKDNIRANIPLLNSNAANTMERIAKDVLGRDYDLRRHPKFDVNHLCCYKLDQSVEWDGMEMYNRMVDEHSTAARTIDEIRQRIQAEHAKYQLIISRIERK